MVADIPIVGLGKMERERRAMVLIDDSLQREKKKNYWNYLMGKMRCVSPDEQVRLLPTLNTFDNVAMGVYEVRFAEECIGIKQGMGFVEWDGRDLEEQFDGRLEFTIACDHDAMYINRRQSLCMLHVYSLLL